MGEARRWLESRDDARAASLLPDGRLRLDAETAPGWLEVLRDWRQESATRSVRATTMKLSRRFALRAGLLAGLAPGAALATAAPARTPPPGAPRFDTDDAAQVRRAYRRMRFSSGEAPFYWWMRGTRFAVIDNRPEPLFEMHVGTIMRCRDAADGGYTVTSLELVFNTDPASGQSIERWRNPYTDEWLELRPSPVGPTRSEYSADGLRAPPQLPGSRIELQSRQGRPIVAGDDVWMTSDQLATVTPETGPGKPFRVTDMATYRSRLSDVFDSRAEFVPCDVSYMDVTDWPRWMRMGERPGTRLARAAGCKAQRWEDMPARWRELVASTFPAIAKDPPGALDLPPFRFER